MIDIQHFLFSLLRSRVFSHSACLSLLSSQLSFFFLQFFIAPFFIFQLLLDLTKCSKPPFFKLFKLLYPLPDLFLLDDFLDQAFMDVWRIEPFKYFHHIVNLFLFPGACLIQSELLFDVQQFSSYYKFFSFNSFIQFMVIYIQEAHFHVELLLCIVIIELHLCQQQLGIIIILGLKVSSSWHISQDFSRVRTSLSHLVNSQPSSL